MSTGALVLFSGGQDSTTCLGWALERYAHVETIGFDYGQRHRAELSCRLTIRDRVSRDFAPWSGRLRDDHVLAIPVLSQISETALTSNMTIAVAANGLPNTFVPARNLLFLALAAAVAYRRGLNVLIGGMCETDFSGYPDCRRDTIDAMAVALSRGLDLAFAVETPLMQLTKAETWQLAHSVGGARFVDLIISDTHTCYLGLRNRRYDWGYGCGTCPACDLRADGYTQWRAQAP